MNKITHEKLVKKARRWLLNNGCPVVISEMACCREQPDAIGFMHGGWSKLIEVKTSRSDFLNELKKPSRRFQCGMGDYRYYLVPEGLMKESELPEGWGLLVWNGKRIEPMESPRINRDKDYRSELNLFISAARRLPGIGLIEGMSVKHYKWRTKNRAVVITKEENS